MKTEANDVHKTAKNASDSAGT